MMADRVLGSPNACSETFAVVGARGKTSVAHALAQVLAVELPCGVIATVGYGFPGDLKTTGDRDVRSLEATLEGLCSRGARAVAIEVSFDALVRARAEDVHFSHALFTGLDGVDLGETCAPSESPAIVEAVLRLFRSPGLKWAVLNLSDPFSKTILSVLPVGVGVAGFVADPTAEPPDDDLLAACDICIRARSIAPMPRGLRLRVACETRDACSEADLAVGLIGAFNAANLLAVMAVLLARGLPLERAARESSRIQGVPGRMECFGDARTPLIVVDEARTPAALETALVNLRKHRPRRIFTVFGCAGERDPAIRPVMGAIAERLSDEVILADDNPRGECGETIVADILAGVVDPSRVRVRRRRALAIRTAIALAGIGDAVLVAGKGHETIQEMGELKVRFSDRAQVVEALREWQEGRR
ncbi:MAG: UDP-N-acetylmuramyl-tripeptide synthetase [Thiocapsa sp.]|uniref:Mur ligase family protein n=1 Tax=Thiocapsa sp. TaxID=2024551 RepID=UPI001BCF86C0|nr:UDP-N-acetylmuramyl-tripeptide synthetase [Thiocapsa sp.]QVL46819.1 MAG: UDP-N-acetylmuramyl-tripeptide synthetase [Thiocapsa sp.]